MVLLPLLAGGIGFVSATIVMAVYQVVLFGTAIVGGMIGTIFGFFIGLPLSIILRNCPAPVIALRVGLPSLAFSVCFAFSGNPLLAILGAVLGLALGVYWALR